MHVDKEIASVAGFFAMTGYKGSFHNKFSWLIGTTINENVSCHPEP